MNFEAIGRYVVSQAREPSTWRGITLILTVVGTQISPQQGEAIMAVGLFMAGMIGAAFPDKRGDK